MSLYSSARIVPEDELIKVILENDEQKNPAIHLESKRKTHSPVTNKRRYRIIKILYRRY